MSDVLTLLFPFVLTSDGPRNTDFLTILFFFTLIVLKKNLRTAISSLPALQNSGLCNVRAYQDRMIRWMRLRVHMLPQLLVLEPIHESVLSGKRY